MPSAVLFGKWRPKTVRHWLYTLLGISLPTLIVIVSTGSGSLTSAIEIGIDEHFEVNKALLWAHGYRLYEHVWNDQPPVHTMMLGIIFNSFGPSIGIARSLAIFFATLLFVSFFLAIKERGGLFEAYMAVACLLVAPQVLELSVSVMLEIPAMAVGLSALLPVQRWATNRRWTSLAASGLLLGTALQIKLTAIVMAPALLFEIFLLSRGNGPVPWKRIVQNLAIFAASLLVCFFALGHILGNSYSQAWTSHFSNETLSSPSRNSAFSIDLLLGHPEALYGIAVGYIILVWRKRWRQLAFPLVLLATVTAVHSAHRPWWDYYYLHFALPLAWITGYGAAELFRARWSMAEREGARFRLGSMFITLAGSIAIGLVVYFGGLRFWVTANRIYSLPRIEGNQLVMHMGRYRPGTKWVYARYPIYAFHARLLSIPELAVVPAKRFWSHAITEAEIWTVIKKYKPEQLLLDHWITSDAESFVNQHYTMVYQDKALRLYIAKSLFDTPPQNRLKTESNP